MAEKGEEEMIIEKNSLKYIFTRSFDDSIFRNKLGQLCASFLGGIWTTGPCQKCPDLITIDLLSKELEICKECLAESGSPLVFSNNDLYEGNLLLRDGIEVTDHGFIEEPIINDMAYCSGFDLCHYCVECCQHNDGKIWPFYEIKQEKWPNEEIQRLYVGAYINEANKKMQCMIDLSDDRELTIQHLLNEIRQFTAFPQLFWAVWSFQRAEISQKEFGHFEYGFDRLVMYYYWKPEMLKYLKQQKRL
uniref:Uncharacterized protein n=1 Tax=Onchocerca volvulus TaxID=6282 RepID=A0A8R1TYL3_ONCVO